MRKQYLQERFSTLSEDEMNVMISISKTYLSDYKQENAYVMKEKIFLIYGRSSFMCNRC